MIVNKSFGLIKLNESGPKSVVPHHLMAQMRDLETFERNWDGDGAENFNDELFEQIRELMDELYKKILVEAPTLYGWLPRPNLLPNADGSIDIEWRDDKLFMLMNVARDGGISIAGKTKGGRILKVKPRKGAEKEILGWIKTVYAKEVEQT